MNVITKKRKLVPDFTVHSLLRFIGVISLVLICFSLIVGCGGSSDTSSPPSPPTPQSNIDHTTYGWVTTAATKGTDGTVSITIMEVPGFVSKTYKTVASLETIDYQSPSTKATRADALVRVLAKGTMAEIRFDSGNNCIDMELIEQSDKTTMDSASYMGELTAKGGGAGNMVAQGWVLAKDATANTVTVGDGNHYSNIFEEKYTLASDAKIYVVNNWADWTLVKAGTFADIKVTAKDSGGKEIYYTPDRHAAVCIFDKNYQSSWKDGTAKVKELYVFNNPTALVNTKSTAPDANGKWISQMYTPDGVQYDGTSWYPLKSKTVEGTQPDYGGSIIPIEMMKNRLYNVGDNYTCIYLFVGADGTLSLLDMGNASAAYQYPLNVAKLGFDPRKVTNIFLTHGHADHYGAYYEFLKMIRQAGIGAGKGWINPYATGATIANSEASFTLGATITDKSILHMANNTLAWDTWLSFLGPDISTYIWRAMGHSNDTASFVIKIKAAKGDAFFKEGDVVSWVYFGGYAVQSGASAGFARNGLVNSLMNQQSVVVPWAQAQSDYVYGLYQHTNQGAPLEVDKATRALGIPYMLGYNEGAEEIGNYCENRISQESYKWVEDAYQTKTDLLETTLWNTPGSLWTTDMRVTGTRNTVKFDSIEEYGPWKRKPGAYTIDIKGVTVVHGYDAWQNQNYLFAGLTNVYGWSLDKGFVIPWNTYAHDPSKWYVQVFGKVNDSYKGGVVQATNWYTLEGGVYMTGVAGTGDKPVTWSGGGGPIEICNTPENWDEFLRTEAFATQAQAEDYAKALTMNTYTTPYTGYSVKGGPLYKYSDKATNYKITDRDGNGGGYSTVKYKVNLDKLGQIKLGKSFQETFVKQ